MDNEKSNKVVHTYDGIEEENNNMPGWWVALFILCCSFAGIYWIHYESGSGTTLTEEYNEAMKKYKEQIVKNSAPVAADTEDTLAVFMKNESAIHDGHEIFEAKCAMCHGQNLEGKVGPNLTDNYWSTGDGSRMAIIKTIINGSPVKGMPPWKGLLKDNEIKSVAAFVYSKIGSNPKNPKPPEGNEIKK